MKLLWSLSARADRIHVFEVIDADSPDAAVRIDILIEGTTERLRDFPLIGRLGRLPGTRELVIPRTPYIAVYRIDDETVLIIRLLHGAQRWPRRS